MARQLFHQLEAAHLAGSARWFISCRPTGVQCFSAAVLVYIFQTVLRCAWCMTGPLHLAPFAVCLVACCACQLLCLHLLFETVAEHVPGGCAYAATGAAGCAVLFVSTFET